ncbi:glycosyltransferase family 2 protein [Planctomicrobium piriforme]|uniref:Glycosyltransferase involved in cell wall bisynthesis n=1 Tax=Planctomicrobium piriforme TaxID=1576369 RepID=A0A1I3CAI0_9PLAN|nr:glycosyltransferase family A protein [Planctomicrobium piriforme]SFH71564.1 Glycosyltransferase involved in cell wall bisynthesis [Planctomicrobium piriforme]
MPVPQISVVIPAYNAEQTIARTLESVLAQSFVPQEIIVVDDGSKDGTAELVARDFPQVTLIRQANAGPAAARNHGVRVANGDWIALLDSDDAWLPEKIKKQLPAMKPGTALVHTHTKQDRCKTTQNITFDVLWHHNHIGTSTVVFNKALFLQVGGFEEDRKFIGAEDYNMWLRLAATGQRIVTIREELTLYTPAENSLSQQIAKVIQAELLNMNTIARQYHLPEEKVAAKRAALYEEYAQALFWMRDLPLARKYYRELLRDRPSATALGYWLATYLPVGVLNMPRLVAQPRRSAAPAVPSAPLVLSR